MLKPCDCLELDFLAFGGAVDNKLDGNKSNGAPDDNNNPESGVDDDEKNCENAVAVNVHNG